MHALRAYKEYRQLTGKKFTIRGVLEMLYLSIVQDVFLWLWSRKRVQEFVAAQIEVNLSPTRAKQIRKGFHDAIQSTQTTVSASSNAAS